MYEWIVIDFSPIYAIVQNWENSFWIIIKAKRGMHFKFNWLLNQIEKQRLRELSMDPDWTHFSISNNWFWHQQKSIDLF